MKQILTKRLVMSLANLNDLPDLEIIEKECDEYFKFDPPSPENHSCPIKDCITIGDIPPNGKRENYYFYCIRQNGIIIGFMSLYMEYQRIDMAYLSVIYIKEEYRQKGIGKEILEGIIQTLLNKNIVEIRLHVSLRNVESLKFFVKQGFDNIIDVGSNGNLLPGNFGGIELSKKLKKEK
ncbi:MAG: GNAT family N-acetyltransferase [Oscillospiraceae bacterium]|nr:GNAT family N-acetyltransferase [Oscillospiraceae bacterium]